jgi:hypothetical protein
MISRRDFLKSCIAAAASFGVIAAIPEAEARPEPVQVSSDVVTGRPVYEWKMYSQSVKFRQHYFMKAPFSGYLKKMKRSQEDLRDQLFLDSLRHKPIRDFFLKLRGAR